MRKVFLFCILGILIGGCAVGNTHRYDLADAALDLKSDKVVAVTVLDLRTYVRSGNKSATFVGLMRGGFGNPFDINTSSGRSLADDMTISIVESLKKNNVKASSVATPPKATEAATRATLLKADADRFVLFLIREWKTDTYVNTGLIYNVSLNVLQRDGTTIAEKDLKGFEKLGMMVVPADARGYAEKAFRQKLEAAFNDPRIGSALQ